jgi:hypothetical protein
MIAEIPVQHLVVVVSLDKEIMGRMTRLQKALRLAKTRAKGLIQLLQMIRTRVTLQALVVVRMSASMLACGLKYHQSMGRLRVGQMERLWMSLSLRDIITWTVTVKSSKGKSKHGHTTLHHQICHQAQKDKWLDRMRPAHHTQNLHIPAIQCFQ